MNAHEAEAIIEQRKAERKASHSLEQRQVAALEAIADELTLKRVSAVASPEPSEKTGGGGGENFSAPSR